MFQHSTGPNANGYETIHCLYRDRYQIFPTEINGLYFKRLWGTVAACVARLWLSRIHANAAAEVEAAARDPEGTFARAKAYGGSSRGSRRANIWTTCGAAPDRFALGVEATRQKRRVLFTRAADLVRQLLEARDSRELTRLQQRLLRVHV